jgi:hypothetical protein
LLVLPNDPRNLFPHMGEEVPCIIWQTQQHNSYMGEEVPWIIWQTQQYNSYMGEEVLWIIWQTQQYNSYRGERFRGSFDRPSNMPVT